MIDAVLRDTIKGDILHTSPFDAMLSSNVALDKQFYNIYLSRHSILPTKCSNTEPTAYTQKLMYFEIHINEYRK
jgi:hypothetical protein